jgi:hypothetical protein
MDLPPSAVIELKMLESCFPPGGEQHWEPQVRESFDGVPASQAMQNACYYAYHPTTTVGVPPPFLRGFENHSAGAPA